MKRGLQYFVAGLTAFSTFFATSISAQNHKQDEIGLRELLLQLPSALPHGIYWNQANIQQITTDTLATIVSGAADTALTRTFSLSQPALPGIYPDSTKILIRYVDRQPLWHPDEQDVLEITLMHTKKANPDTTRKLQKQNHQSIFSILNLKTGKRYPVQESQQDTLITEWYRSGGLNGWFPGQAPLDPRDKGSVVITIGNQKLSTTPPQARYNSIRQSLTQLLTTPPDTTGTEPQ